MVVACYGQKLWAPIGLNMCSLESSIIIFFRGKWFGATAARTGVVIQQMCKIQAHIGIERWCCIAQNDGPQLYQLQGLDMSSDIRWLVRREIIPTYTWAILTHHCGTLLLHFLFVAQTPIHVSPWSWQYCFVESPPWTEKAMNKPCMSHDLANLSDIPWIKRQGPEPRRCRAAWPRARAAPGSAHPGARRAPGAAAIGAAGAAGDAALRAGAGLWRCWGMAWGWQEVGTWKIDQNTFWWNYWKYSID